MPITTVKVVLQRHGAKKPAAPGSDALSAEGIQQVTESRLDVHRELKGMCTVFGHSRLQRARQTAEIIAVETTPIEVPELGYDVVAPEAESTRHMETAMAICERISNATAKDLLEAYGDHGLKLRASVQTGIIKLARMAAIGPHMKSDAFAYGATHGMFLELGAPDDYLDRIPWMINPAEFISFMVDVDPTSPKLDEIWLAQYLPTPPPVGPPPD